MKELKFYYCEHCKNIVVKLHDKGVPVVCCGEKMKEMVTGEIESATEKHVPVIEINGQKVTVKVGSVEHPMLEEHHIGFICLETTEGMQVKWLKVGEKPEACFALLEGEKAVAAYEFCNLHGLWKANA